MNREITLTQFFIVIGICTLVSGFIGLMIGERFTIIYWIWSVGLGLSLGLYFKLKPKKDAKCEVEE